MDEAAPAMALDSPFTTLRTGNAILEDRDFCFSCPPMLPLVGKADDVLSDSGTELLAGEVMVSLARLENYGADNLCQGGYPLTWLCTRAKPTNGEAPPRCRPTLGPALFLPPCGQCCLIHRVGYKPQIM